MKHVPYDIALKLRELGFKKQLEAGNLIGYNLSWKDRTNVSYPLFRMNLVKTVMEQ